MAKSRFRKSLTLNFRTGGLVAIMVGILAVVLNFIRFVKVPFIKNSVLAWIVSVLLSLLVIQLAGLFLRSRLAAKFLRPLLSRSPLCERLFKSILGSSYLAPTVRPPLTLEDAGAKTLSLQEINRAAIEEFLTYSNSTQAKEASPQEKSRWVDRFLADLRRKVDKVVPPLNESELTTSAKEVLVPFGGDSTYVAGILVRFVTYPKPISGGGVEQLELAVVFVPTAPMPFTGYLPYVRKGSLIYTGRTAQECCLTVMSLGMN